MTVLQKLVTALEARTAPVRWWRWPLVIGLVLVGLLVAYWLVNRQRKELARLRHEVYAQKQAAKQAVTDAAVATDQEEVRRLLAAADEAEKAAMIYGRGLEQLRREHDATNELAARITWDDLPRGDAPGGDRPR